MSERDAGSCRGRGRGRARHRGGIGAGGAGNGKASWTMSSGVGSVCRDGRASVNQITWLEASPSRSSIRCRRGERLVAVVIDEWMANIRDNPDAGVAGNKPALATDRCFTTGGTEIAHGADVWDGILDSGPKGACAQEFPLHSTSRIVAGGPIRGGVYKCALQSVDDAIAGGVYGSWTPTAAETARLQEIFPSGVCDYSQPDVGRP